MIRCTDTSRIIGCIYTADIRLNVLLNKIDKLLYFKMFPYVWTEIRKKNYPQFTAFLAFEFNF